MADRRTSGSAGWALLSDARWDEAQLAFEADLSVEEDASAFDGLGQARWWSSDIAGAVEAWEHAFRNRAEAAALASRSFPADAITP